MPSNRTQSSRWRPDGDAKEGEPEQSSFQRRAKSSTAPLGTSRLTKWGGGSLENDRGPREREGERLQEFSRDSRKLDQKWRGSERTERPERPESRRHVFSTGRGKSDVGNLGNPTGRFDPPAIPFPANTTRYTRDQMLAVYDKMKESNSISSNRVNIHSDVTVEEFIEPFARILPSEDEKNDIEKNKYWGLIRDYEAGPPEQEEQEGTLEGETTLADHSLSALEDDKADIQAAPDKLAQVEDDAEKAPLEPLQAPSQAKVDSTQGLARSKGATAGYSSAGNDQLPQGWLEAKFGSLTSSLVDDGLVEHEELEPESNTRRTMVDTDGLDIDATEESDSFGLPNDLDGLNGLGDRSGVSPLDLTAKENGDGVAQDEPLPVPPSSSALPVSSRFFDGLRSGQAGIVQPRQHETVLQLTGSFPLDMVSPKQSPPEASVYHASSPMNRLDNHLGSFPPEIQGEGHLSNLHILSQAVAPPPMVGWYYKDPLGRRQGPFPGTDILEWLDARYYGMDLPVQREDAGDDAPFMPLGHVLHEVRASTMPPVLPNTHSYEHGSHVAYPQPEASPSQEPTTLEQIEAQMLIMSNRQNSWGKLNEDPLLHSQISKSPSSTPSSPPPPLPPPQPPTVPSEMQTLDQIEPQMPDNMEAHTLDQIEARVHVQGEDKAAHEIESQTLEQIESQFRNDHAAPVKGDKVNIMEMLTEKMGSAPQALQQPKKITTAKPEKPIVDTTGFVKVSSKKDRKKRQSKQAVAPAPAPAPAPMPTPAPVQTGSPQPKQIKPVVEESFKKPEPPVSQKMPQVTIITGK